ncbi:Gfo/Idh/MocA family protein [Halobacillus kuroshimensis]|uniref:Gfo/Idh/MocA family protein n=1 Tax=Halobacillus kuroshimensis TaxID=302481 RepID=UPI00041CBDA7|nr:Gfo/Idh/MocA family oxidoreductase [Halobacillus kuroshimensis]
MRKLKAGIIGCGSIAEQKYMPALMKLKEKVEVVSFCNRHLDKAQKLAEKFHVKQPDLYKNYQDLLQDESIDMIFICTPNCFHSEMTVASLEAGKHVMCEKPMAINTKEAKRMLEVSEKTGKKLTIGYQNRFRKDSLLLKKACDHGDLGEIYAAKAHAVRRRGVPTWGVFMNKELQGGGSLIDIGTHALDLALWCMNNYEVDSVTGVTFNKLKDQNQANLFGPWDPETFDVEESALAFIKMKNGSVIHLESAWALHTLDDREAMTTLSGTKGGAVMQRNKAANRDELIFHGDMYGELYEKTIDNHSSIAYTPSSLITDADKEIGQWIDALIEEKDPVVTPYQAYVVTKIIDAVYRSAETGETIIYDELDY